MKVKAWIEATRLRTLPVSIAGVLVAWGWAFRSGLCDLTPGILCMAFALLAQIASNFANEYFDYTAGRDKRGRSGPRRGVTEGDISPRAMLKATLVTLGIAGCIGLSLVAWGGWWLLAVGALIAVGVFAYSTGPYPLSTHCLGEVAVMCFFGIIPVNFTFWLMTASWSLPVFLSSIAVGLMGANVLIINNYRDVEDDRAVAKRTLAVRLGRPAMRYLYATDVAAAAVLTVFATGTGVAFWWLAPGVYLVISAIIALQLGRRQGAKLTPLLGATALSMFIYSLLCLCVNVGS